MRVVQGFDERCNQKSSSYNARAPNLNLLRCCYNNNKNEINVSRTFFAQSVLYVRTALLSSVPVVGVKATTKGMASIGRMVSLRLCRGQVGDTVRIKRVGCVVSWEGCR